MGNEAHGGHNETKNEQLDIVVGYDMRTSSPTLTEALIKGLTDQGVNVVDIGLVATPTFYFGVGHYGYDGGVMVSASHNPAEYNGFKMTREQAKPISGDTGINQLKDLVIANNFVDAQTKGEVVKKTDVLKDQIEHDLKFVDLSKIKPFKILARNSNCYSCC